MLNNEVHWRSEIDALVFPVDQHTAFAPCIAARSERFSGPSQHRKTVSAILQALNMLLEPPHASRSLKRVFRSAGVST